MSLYITGYRVEPSDPFNEALDDQALKREIQNRAIGLWGAMEGHLRKGLTYLGGKKPPKRLNQCISQMRKLIEDHRTHCPLAGTWIGRTKVKVPPYQFSDYQWLDSFDQGMRTQSCELSHRIMRDLDKFELMLGGLNRPRHASQHEGENWEHHSIGKVLNMYGQFQTLQNIALSIETMSLDFYLGNHIPIDALSKPERTHYSFPPNETSRVVSKILRKGQADEIARREAEMTQHKISLQGIRPKLEVWIEFQWGWPPLRWGKRQIRSSYDSLKRLRTKR